MVNKQPEWTWALYPPWEGDSPVVEFIEDQGDQQQARIFGKFDHLSVVRSHPLELGPDHVEKVDGTSDPPVYEYKIKGGVHSYRFLFTCVKRTVVFLLGLKKTRRLRGKHKRTAQSRAIEVAEYYGGRKP